MQIGELSADLRTSHVQRGCIYCVYCREYGHMRNYCPQLRAKIERERQREAERRRWEEKERVREEREKAREEENARRETQRRINRGELAVGDGGKTVPMWIFSAR